MRRMFVVVALVAVLPTAAAAQDPPRPAEQPGPYPFIVLDSPPIYFTMRQVNQDYLSGYRLFARTLNEHLNPIVSVALQGAACLLFLKTMTHEQGHQTILGAEHIASHQRSFPFMDRAGYVDGVTDAALQNLRDTKFPTFARLHTAGVESDYMLATREETLMAFGDESYQNVAVDYLLRKSAVMFYLLEGVFKRNTDDDQEPDELKRDIVGNDIYGIVRHWFRPEMAFARYTRYEDLTAQEHGYLERIQWRTLFNLANTNIVGIRSFQVTDALRANVGMAHALGPFGDFIDERVWLNYRSTVKASAYVREFENRDRWFFAAGAGVYDYRLTDRLRASATLHYWNQPAGLSFTSTTGKSGGAVDLSASYRVVASQGPHPQSLSLDVGMIYKTEGFLPEEVELDRHFGVRVGLTVGLHF